MGPDESYRYLPPDELSKIIDTSRIAHTYSPIYMRSPDGSISLASEPTPLWSDHIAPDSYYKPASYYRWGDYGLNTEPYREEDKPSMSWYEETQTTEKYKDRHLFVQCTYPPDLDEHRILKSIAIMKSEMQMKCVPVKIDRFECRMTPAVKHNIISACRRLERYGKKTPFIARFDEYGRRLDDEVKIDTLRGMIIKIVDPIEYGTHYIQFEGIVRDWKK